MHRFTSLRQKIIFAYAIIGTAILALSLFTLLELRWMEDQVLAGEQISKFYDTILELRRFEKNYFLYHQPEDFRQHSEYLQLAQRLLRENVSNFKVLTTPAQMVSLNRDLQEYERLFDTRNSSQSAIRDLGKELLKQAQEIAQTERQQLRSSLARHRYFVFISVVCLMGLVIGMGHLLYHMVAKPLKQVEEQMAAVAQGQLNRLTIAANDQEMVSLSETFNRVLRELEVRQKHLLRSEKLASLGTLLSGVAHELNNPLSNISTSCQILLEELASIDKEFQRELLLQVDEQSNRMRNIVRSLLDFAKDRQFTRERLRLATLLQETLRFLRGQVATQVTITVEIVDDLEVYGDKQRLQQVFLNLLKNAVEAVAGEGEVTILAQRHEGIEIEIRDNGLGIPAEILPKIFDPFFTTKDVGKGFGLGLAMVHDIIEEHEGSVTVVSVPGQGTSFFLRLPSSVTDER